MPKAKSKSKIRTQIINVPGLVNLQTRIFALALKLIRFPVGIAYAAKSHCAIQFRGNPISVTFSLLPVADDAKPVILNRLQTKRKDEKRRRESFSFPLFSLFLFFSEMSVRLYRVRGASIAVFSGARRQFARSLHLAFGTTVEDALCGQGFRF